MTLLAAAVLALLSGCATDGQITDPSVYLGNPFQHPSEAGFRALVQANCGPLSIGSTTVNALLGKNTAFDSGITALYDGDVSNDEFMNQVLLQYPAPDANVPATGCIMNQLAQCFAETCKVQTAAEREKMAQAETEAVKEIESAVTLDPSDLPTKDASEIERMIETSKEDGPKPLP
ncbi:MAG: hypothetical protein VBE63_01250 [Lamprobacter sp.]|uniref:hypothetical protein n=1 Tax=Lamprobacter sp. TaxID=3100796 RepID=UPI002B25D76B|nr:hypothetical protein [Lamprobacter sp.]MEA3638553.1 hypothetical protein [Lamprobacter sp.]